MRQWDYKVIELERNFGPGSAEKPLEILSRQLDRMGKEGWELAALVPASYRRNAEAHQRELVSALLCFKREMVSA
jgi:hypothetical protein